MIPAPYWSQDACSGGARDVSAADAIVSSIQGDHDRELLSDLQSQLGRQPVVSWKTIFALVAAQGRD